jgi:hypothetical protein
MAVAAQVVTALPTDMAAQFTERHAPTMILASDRMVVTLEVPQPAQDYSPKLSCIPGIGTPTGGHTSTTISRLENEGLCPTLLILGGRNMKATDIGARILAVIVGIALLLFVAFVSDLWSKTSSLILFTFFVATYSVAGMVLGFIWPNSGWRLGAYLFSIVPLFVLASILFSDPPPVIHWKEEFLGLFGWVLILPGALLGTWAGSLIRRSVSNLDQPIDS